MKINVDRLCQLAGVETGSSNVLSEASNRSYHDEDNSDELQFRYGDKAQLAESPDEDAAMEEEEVDETVYEEEAYEESDMDEMIEVDEVELVQELRRARAMIAEAKKDKQTLQEAELKRIIQSEVENVMKDLNLTSGWVYGEKKPKSGMKGYVHQGSFLKGIGFE